MQFAPTNRSHGTIRHLCPGFLLRRALRLSQPRPRVIVKTTAHSLQVVMVENQFTPPSTITTATTTTTTATSTSGPASWKQDGRKRQPISQRLAVATVQTKWCLGGLSEGLILQYGPLPQKNDLSSNFNKLTDLTHVTKDSIRINPV